MYNPKPYPPILGYNETLERRLKTFWDFNDWMNISIYSHPWTASLSGTGAIVGVLAATSNRIGVVALGTGTTATGTAGYFLSNTSGFLFGAGVYTYETDVYVPALSTVTETYALYVGLGDSATTEPVDGAYFKYTDAGESPNWYAVTANNSTRTSTDTSTAVAAITWTRLKVVVNANASSVGFYINGANVANNTANIPTAAGRNTSAMFSIIKSAGTTARTLDVDWTWVHVDLNASR